MLASCKWLWQWVPFHQRKKVQGVGNINALLFSDALIIGPFFSKKDGLKVSF